MMTIKETRNTTCMHVYHIVLIIMLIYVWGSTCKSYCTVCTQLPVLKVVVFDVIKFCFAEVYLTLYHKDIPIFAF